MNDISRLLHQFVLHLYPNCAEARAGLCWIVSKAFRSRSKSLHSLVPQHSNSPHVRTQTAISHVSSERLVRNVYRLIFNQSIIYYDSRFVPPTYLQVTFLQHHLCGILAFFDSRLLDDECPLEERRRCLLSLAIFMDLLGSQPVSRMRAKFIATLK